MPHCNNNGNRNTREDDDFIFEMCDEDEILRRMRSASVAEEESIEISPESSFSAPRRKAKKKQKKREPQAPQEPPLIILSSILFQHSKRKEKELQCSVRFGTIHYRELKRCIALDAVPTDNGGFPLGLSDEILYEYDRTLDEHEQIKKQQDPTSSSSNSSKDVSSRPNSSGAFNPSFVPLSEPFRKMLLLSSMDSNYHFPQLWSDKALCKDTSTTSHNMPLSSSPNRRTTRQHHKITASAPQQYHNLELEHYCVVIRNELERIRNDRSVTGCNCCRLNVSGSSKKQHHHHPMNDRKLRDELRKRKLLHPDEMSSKIPLSPEKKQELVQRLQDATEKEPCCRDDNCPCVQNQIECHESSCSCYTHSKGVTDNHNSNNYYLTMVERCGNVYGLDLVNVEEIRKKRSTFVNRKPLLLKE